MPEQTSPAVTQGREVEIGEPRDLGLDELRVVLR
jgi:hypothetical protein